MEMSSTSAQDEDIVSVQIKPGLLGWKTVALTTELWILLHLAVTLKKIVNMSVKLFWWLEYSTA